MLKLQKLKLEQFFKEQLWQLLLVVAFVSFCGWALDRVIQAIFFYISHSIVRYKFSKQYHCIHSNQRIATFLCVLTTLSIMFLSIAISLPLCVSLLSALPICYFICWVGYLAQDRIDCKKIIEKLNDKNIWQMNETELAEYCYANGVRGDMLEFVIMVVIHKMKYREIATKLSYSVDTLKDWSPKCKKKLNIKNWKQ